MDEDHTVGEGRRGGLPVGLVGMLLLVAGIEGLLAGHRQEFTAFIPASWRQSARSVAREAVGRDLLCFGDSQVKSGLLPEVIAQRRGWTAFNLAVIGGQAPSSYYLLERALKAGARPKAILVDTFPMLLGADFRINTRQWPELLDARECLALAWTARDAQLAGPILLGALLPSVRMREEVRRQIACALRGEADPKQIEARAYRRNWRLNGGACAHARNPDFREAVGSEPDEGTGERVWHCQPENERYLRRFLTLAGSKGLPVFWLLPLNSPEVQANRERTGLDAAFVRFVRGLQAEFPGLVVLDVRQAGLNVSAFHDEFHVNCRGAVALSEAVADVLNRPLPAGPEISSWINLSLPADPVSKLTLEDVEQSRRAVR